MALNYEDEELEVIHKPQNDEKNTEKTEHDDTKKKNDAFFLYFSAFIANLIYVAGAADFAWTSPVIPKLQTNDTNINPLGVPVTAYDISLIAGLPKLAGLTGTLLFGKLPDLVGRRKTLIYMALGMVVSNLFVAFGWHIYVYFICRSLFSLCFGGAVVALSVYLSEIAEDHNRVRFGCFMNVCFPVGNLLSYVVGPITSVRVFTLICISPLLPALLFFMISIPESPVYLASNSSKMETIKALTKLRSNKSPEQIEKDYSNLQKLIEARRSEQPTISVWPFRTKALKKAFIIATILNAAQHSSGTSIIMSFLGPIFNEASSQHSGNTEAIIVGIVKISAFFTTSIIVEKLGRRPLLLFSSASTGIPLLILGLYFYWKNDEVYFLDSIRWLPIVIVLIYIVCYSIGLGPIPSAMTSELFPSDVRALAVGYQMTFVGFLTFMMTAAFPILVDVLGIQYCIWFFSMNCFLGFIAFYYVLPETKGKSALEIQMMLSK